MRSGIRCFVITLAAVGICFAQRPAQVAQSSSSYAQLPLTFEENQGQVNPQVKFLARGKGYTAFLSSEGIALSLRSSGVVKSGAVPDSRPVRSVIPSNTILQFNLVGANTNPRVVGEAPQAGRVNYFIGSDRSKWHTNVPTYGSVRYKNVYPGIDLVYYGNHRQLEYSFEVSPDADPTLIQFEIEGASQIELAANGDLIVKTHNAALSFQSPTFYQINGGSRVQLQGKYLLKSPTRVGFQVVLPDSRDPIVIDQDAAHSTYSSAGREHPQPMTASPPNPHSVVYSTYLGGSGDDFPTGLAVDSSGSVYVSGYTDSTGFPVTAVGDPYPGADHVFVAKLDPSGSTLVYADYIGGSGYDYGYALALDSANEVYVTGSTSSPDFPVVNAYQSSYPGSFNAFITKLSGDGSSLLYSTYLGGNGSDTPASIALDGLSDILVAGSTTSTNFPVANAYQSSASPNQGSVYGTYGFLTEFVPDGSSLVYSTYLAGNSNVANNCGGTPCWVEPSSLIQALAVDGSGNAYVAGYTNTYNFPTTSGTYQTTNQTQSNAIIAFVSKISPSGTLSYSTYFYESSGLFTEINAIAVDASDSAYVSGFSYSDGTFPVTSTAICDPTVYGIACSYAFVTKFDATASTLVYSTFLGPNNYATPAALVLDSSNDAFVLASTTSSSFGIVNGVESYSGGNDVLLAEVDPVAGSELFATYLGGSSDETGVGMALDSGGNLYIAGTTDSTDFPTTEAAFQTQFGGNTDGFVTKISASSAASVSLNPYSLQYSSQQVGSTSSSQQVLLRNMSSGSVTVSISATGDFGETDNCGTSVPAASSCTLSVTFTPTAPGLRTGSIAISDSAAGSPQTVALSGTGLGSAATFSPTSLIFPSIQVGTSSAGEAVTLTNPGNESLSVSNIQITGDYGQTNNCPATLATNSSCVINVTFTPTAAGSRSGSITISDNAFGSPQTVALSGTGLQTALSLTPTSLTFLSTPVGTSSATQHVTLSNQGNENLNISSIQITAGYQQSNNCPGSLVAGSSCTIGVTFTPTASGNRVGTIGITDSAAGSPQVVTLGGTGSDFKLASSSPSTTISAGATASYALSVSPVGGAFTDPIKLSCSGIPAQSTCSLSPASVTPNSNPATVNLTIATTSSSAKAFPVVPGQMHPMYAAWVQLQGLGLVGMLFMAPTRRRKRLLTLVLLALVLSGALFMTACAGGTGIVPTGGSGTAAGTYTVTVTGASGNLQHSLTLTLVVQ